MDSKESQHTKLEDVKHTEKNQHACGKRGKKYNDKKTK